MHREYRVEVVTALSDGRWTPLYRVDMTNLEPVRTQELAKWAAEYVIKEHDEIRRKYIEDGIESGMRVHEIYSYRIMMREVGDWNEVERVD